MNWEELLKRAPKLEAYIKHMPPDIKARSVIKVIPPGQIIHQKNYELDYFAFVCCGDHRAINEFENGNVYMIEKNEAIDFVGGAGADLCHPGDHYGMCSSPDAEEGF